MDPEASSSIEANNNNGSFVVQRGRTVPTLTSVYDKSDKEQFNKDTKSEELGESENTGGGPEDVFQQMKNIPVAGRPSDAPSRASIYSKKSTDVTATADTNVSSAGAGGSATSGLARSTSFSRRNSVDENASSLSVENFGGSQDNLSMLGRNPDKEMRTHTGRRGSEVGDHQPQPPNNDNRSMDKREIEEMEKLRMQRESMSPQKGQFVRLSSDGTPVHQDKVSFADLRRQKARDQFHTSGINITYTEQEKEDLPKKSVNLRKEAGGGQPPSSAMTSSNNQQSDSNSSPG